jgi:transposase-like protein
MQNCDSAQSDKDLRNVITINEAQIQDHLGEMVRSTVEETFNAMLDAEENHLCGVKRYERSARRTNGRAGHYGRSFHTKAGEVELKTAKLHYAKFETAIIERYKRRESSVGEALMEMYLAGVSVRRVEDVTEALWGIKISAGTVSNLNQKMYERIEAWRNEPIKGTYPYVYLDGISLKRTWSSFSADRPNRRIAGALPEHRYGQCVLPAV